MEAAEAPAQLREALDRARGKPLVVLLSGHPDPDAIGSALAHQRICEEAEVPCTIAHVLPVSRPENRALVKLLNIQMIHIEDSEELKQYEFVSLVDTNTIEKKIELPESLHVLTVVDHHRDQSQALEADFVDIRPTYGATASIYTEYLESGLGKLTLESPKDSRIATALLFGIETDTDDFSLATSADFRAAAALKPFADGPLIGRIGHRTMTAETMGAVGRALLDLEVLRDFAFAGVGRISQRDRDAIPTAADFILRREDIDTVVVYGIVNDRIDGSLRTNSASVDPALFLETAFGKDSNGQPYGGGRADKGGFQIPLGLMADAEDTDSLAKMVKQVVRKRLARVIPDLEGNGHTNGR